MPAPRRARADIDGQRRRGLSKYLQTGITLLGFIYTTAPIPTVPLATGCFDALKENHCGQAPAPRPVRFVTLSFDPAARHAEANAPLCGDRLVEIAAGLRWYFLTTRSARSFTRSWKDSVRRSPALDASCRTC